MFSYRLFFSFLFLFIPTIVTQVFPHNVIHWEGFFFWGGGIFTPRSLILIFHTSLIAAQNSLGRRSLSLKLLKGWKWRLLTIKSKGRKIDVLTSAMAGVLGEGVERDSRINFDREYIILYRFEETNSEIETLLRTGKYSGRARSFVGDFKKPPHSHK